MLSVILTGLLTLLCAAYAAALFRGRGPLPTTQYLLARPDERVRMKTREEYRFTARVMSLLALVFLMATIAILTDDSRLLWAILPTCAVLAAYAAAHSIREAAGPRR
jgi:hypothetical protein